MLLLELLLSLRGRTESGCRCSTWRKTVEEDFCNN